MLALVAASSSEVSKRVVLGDVPDPEPSRHEALVRVRAVSLNRGEVRNLATAAPGWRPGWDVAGTIEVPARDGTGPTGGVRVVGLVNGGGWAERVAVPTRNLAPIPQGVSFEAASTLPVAGLTALLALRQGGQLLGRRVLVTGAAGGVGRFAVQLAARSGAHVTAVVGSAVRAAGLAELGAHSVLVGFGPEPPKDGPFDLILESVGGASLATALAAVAPGGLIVSYGNSSQEPTTFNVTSFYRLGGARLSGFILFHELERSLSGTRDLTDLAARLDRKELDPQIALTQSWRNPGKALDALMARNVSGKAVLRVD